MTTRFEPILNEEEKLALLGCLAISLPWEDNSFPRGGFNRHVLREVCSSLMLPLESLLAVEPFLRIKPGWNSPQNRKVYMLALLSKEPDEVPLSESVTGASVPSDNVNDGSAKNDSQFNDDARIKVLPSDGVFADAFDDPSRDSAACDQHPLVLWESEEFSLARSGKIAGLLKLLPDESKRKHAVRLLLALLVTRGLYDARTRFALQVVN